MFKPELETCCKLPRNRCWVYLGNLSMGCSAILDVKDWGWGLIGSSAVNASCRIQTKVGMLVEHVLQEWLWWSHWWSHWSFLSDHGWEGELVEAGHKQRSNSFLSSPSACVGNALKTSVSSHVEFLLQAMILKPWHGYSVSVRRVSRVSCRTASMPRIYMIMVAAALSTAAARLWLRCSRKLTTWRGFKKL